MLCKATENPQSITEDMVLYGMAENKLEVCSLELASWLSDIEANYNLEIPMDTLKVSDIIDKIVETQTGEVK